MNSTGTRVVFVHGLWLGADSWGAWIDLFREAGYAPIAPGWPGDGATSAETRSHPERVAGHGIGDIVEHYAQIIRGLDAAKVNTANATRGPLLITAGGKDHTVPAAISKQTLRLYRKSPAVTELKEFPDRGHSLALDSGWRDVADTTLAWLESHSQ